MISLHRTKLSRAALLLCTSMLVGVSLAACEDPQQRAATHLQRGIEQFASKNFDQARIELRNALQLQPTNGEAYYYLGRLQEAQDHIPEAVRAYMQAVAQAPEHVDANVRLGRFLLLAGDPASALANAERIITISDGKNAEGYALRAGIRAAQNELAAAEEDALLALDLDPANVAAAAALAGVYERRGERSRAIETIADALAKNPNDVSLHVAKLAFHVADDDRPKAEAESLALVALQPDNNWHRVRLGQLYVAWDRLDDAQKLLRDGAEKAPATVDAKLAYIDFLVNRRSFDDARTVLARYADAQPKEYRLRFALAELFNRNSLPNDAIATLNQIASAAKGTPDALNAQAGIATLMLAQGRQDDARKMVDEVLKAEPENPGALLLKGRLQIADNKVAEAIESLRTVLRNTPDSVPALTLLSQAYRRNGQGQLAADTLRKVIEADPRNMNVRVELAQLLAGGRQADAALKVLNDALLAAPGNVLALATKADILTAQGRYSEARAAAGPINDAPDGRGLYLTLMGSIAAAQGHHEEAIAAFQFARAADPNQWQPINGMVRSMAYAGQFDDAISVLKDALEQHPGDDLVRSRLADMYAASGKFDDALATYEDILTRHPRDAATYTRIVGVHYLQNDEPKALETLRRATQANPDPALSTALALGLEKAGHYQEAIDVYERLQASGTRNLLVLNNLGALIADYEYNDPARVSQAIKMMEPLQTTDNANVIDTIGWLHLRAGRTAEALSYLKRAVALDPKSDLLKRHLGEAYQRAGDAENARKYLVETP